MVLVHTSGLWSHREKREEREERRERKWIREKRRERRKKLVCVTKTKILGPGPHKCFSQKESSRVYEKNRLPKRRHASATIF